MLNEGLRNRWHALGLHMTLRGVELYPQWWWDLYVGEPTYVDWCCDKLLIVAIKVHRVYTDKHGRTGNHGTIIEIPERFVLDISSLSIAEKRVIIDGILADAIKNPPLVNYRACYQPLSQPISVPGKE